MLTPPAKSFYGRLSYKRQLWAEILLAPGAETALLGIFLLTRIFDPSRLDVTLLFALNHASFLAAPWITDRIRSWSAARVCSLVMALSVPPLLAAALLRGFWGIGPLLVLANSAFVTIMVPLRNRMMRSNYTNFERGASYGQMKSVATALFFGIALAGAFRLTDHPTSIYWMLPILGVSTFFGLRLLRRYPVRGEKRALRRENETPKKSTAEIYGELFRLFRNHRRFRMFEIGFMIYGLGFMLTIPQEISAVTKETNIQPIGIVVGIHGITPFIKMLFISFFGRLLDRRGVAQTASLAFLLLAIYPLAVWSAVAFGSVAAWFLARAAFGMAMAGVDVCWSLGPVMFGGADKAANYSAAHIFAVGVRAAIVPVIGYLVYTLIGSGVYAVGSAVLVLAAMHMLTLHRQEKEFAYSKSG